MREDGSRHNRLATCPNTTHARIADATFAKPSVPELVPPAVLVHPAPGRGGDVTLLVRSHLSLGVIRRERRQPDSQPPPSRPNPVLCRPRPAPARSTGTHRASYPARTRTPERRGPSAESTCARRERPARRRPRMFFQQIPSPPTLCGSVYRVRNPGRGRARATTPSPPSRPVVCEPCCTPCEPRRGPNRRRCPPGRG